MTSRTWSSPAPSATEEALEGATRVAPVLDKVTTAGILGERKVNEAVTIAVLP